MSLRDRTGQQTCSRLAGTAGHRIRNHHVHTVTVTPAAYRAVQVLSGEYLIALSRLRKHRRSISPFRQQRPSPSNHRDCPSRLPNSNNSRIHSVRLPDPHHVYPAAADHAWNVPEKHVTGHS